ncbi:hypothetical protein TTHERM_00195870 (macronuclear) [Tetrahymena thermophila SB210]|uniref:Uncharacterized protein n=1 Tax=Tetrahymena thermophila (strain SB210) TaxID=312017 RepID=Q23K47_TETTS|nr:hypothetical protein TTHERM_00195870 [Tetrahymena thermophila SB210]EAR96996.2 hypothetical protein TTHERM_00195870 [Tetrahymena thermophila SB210]|eukprot:XP_001017241.2 hypothetical protein TTHERM_00195870 [Tetrahymena thermophila SB210]
MNQAKYNKYKNSTIKAQSQSNQKLQQNKTQSNQQTENPSFYQYSVENSKKKQSISQEEKTMSSEDLNDRIKEIISRHGGYIYSETSPISEQFQDVVIGSDFNQKAEQAAQKPRDASKKKKIIESQLKKLSSSGSSSADRFTKNNFKKDKNLQQQQLPNQKRNKVSQSQRDYIFEQNQDQTSSSEVNQDATNYSFSEGIHSGAQIQEQKNQEEVIQQQESKISNRLPYLKENDNKYQSQDQNSGKQKYVNEQALQNSEINESFGNNDTSQIKYSTNLDRSNLQNITCEKYSTPLKEYDQKNFGKSKDCLQGSESQRSQVYNPITNSILESSFKKQQPNSKLSLENSIKNIKIKNLTRIKLIVKPPLLVSEICRGMVGLFCLSDEINEDESFLSKMNVDWTEIQPKFNQPGEMMNLICRTKSLIKNGKINERNIRYVSKTLDSIEQVVKMEEENREYSEMQSNHFENQVIMENMVVFVDFLGATCDYFFRTSQSNLPISIDTYMNTNKNKKESAQKYPNHAYIDTKNKNQIPQSIQISSYLEEQRDNRNMLSTQSSMFPNTSYVMSNKSEQIPLRNDSQFIQNSQARKSNVSQNDRSPQSCDIKKMNKFINHTPNQDQAGNQKYFLSKSRNNYSLKIQPHDFSNSNLEESKYISDVNNSNNGYNRQSNESIQKSQKTKQNLVLNKTSDTYYGLGSPSTQKLNSTFTTNITQSRSQTPTSEVYSQKKNTIKPRGSSLAKQQLNASNQKINQQKNIFKKSSKDLENQENEASVNINRSTSRNKINQSKPLKESINSKNTDKQIPQEQDFRKNRLEKIMELKVKKPKVESFVKKMIKGDPIYQDVLLKKQRNLSNDQNSQNLKNNNSHLLSGYHQMCDQYEHQKSHLSEKLQEVQNQVIQLSQRANKAEWDDKRYAKQTQMDEENSYQKFDLNFKREEHQRLKDFQKSVNEDEKQLLKEQSVDKYLMNRSRREYEKSVQIQNNAEEEFRSYVDLKYKQAMQRRQLLQQKSELDIKKQEYEDIRNYKSHQKSFEILEQKSRYGDEEVSRLNYSIQKSVEKKNELEKRLEKTLDVIYNFRKLTSFKNLHEFQ